MTEEDFTVGVERLQATAEKCRPGTLTVSFGNRRITLDALDPQDKFDRAMKAIEEMLTEAGWRGKRP